MDHRLLVAIVFMGALLNADKARAEPAFPFVDGRWAGDIEPGAAGTGLAACWARTTFADGTAFTLARRRDGSWHLNLSNSAWRLPPSHRYTMKVLVDFYPQLRIVAEAKSQTRLEIAHIDQNSLLGFIENGHTIDLASDGFNARYDLEGSAKAIDRVRHCSTG
jgi:hypothetical protein